MRSICSVLVLLALSLSALGCGGQQRVQRTQELPLGLYKVTSRSCSYPEGAPEDCTRTRYLETSRGKYESVASGVALTFWSSEHEAEEHTFSVHDTDKGRFMDAQTYVLSDDEFAREWLVVANGKLVEYFFVRHPRASHAGILAGRSHLTLQYVPRTQELTRLLPYPPEAD